MKSAKEIRRQIIEVSYRAGACHIGSALSCVEILLAIEKVKRDNDIFVFGKASGVAAYYCLKYPPEKATEILKKYPLPSKEAGLIWSGGSLGQGLSVACGLALKIKDRNVYCLISDGELQEGQTWEAIMFAAHHKINNLIAIIDRNGLQALGNTEEINALEPLRQRFESFGWDVAIVDGHDEDKIKKVLKNKSKKPKAVIAKTIKGKGVDFTENKYEWHYKNLDQEGSKRAIRQLAD